MSLFGFLFLLLIASICGAIGQSIAGYSLGGCFVSIIVGFIGAWLGPLIAKELELPMFYIINIQGKDFPVIWSIIGSALFALVVGSITRGRKQQP
ncbi:MAG: hypothetical protein FIA82_07470 [Melioribacter sp.]|nr:hypothetical protein [Melioribacter sp.]